MNFAMSLIFTYYLVAIIQTVFHRLFGHKKRIATIFETHALGHHRVYPPSNLLSEQWRDSQVNVMWYYAIPIAPIFMGLLVWGSLQQISGFILGTVISIAWHIYLHEQYHIAGSKLERFSWFMNKRALHFEHHRHPRRNYAIVEYWIDDLMNTKKSAQL